MAMNTQRIVVGGLAAGLVLNVIGFVVHGYLLRSRMEEEMNAAAPGLAEGMMTGGVVAAQVISQFVVGILLVWLYAAVRPRFGPGMRTASYAALFVWALGFLFYQDWFHLGLMTGASYMIVSVIMLVTLLVAAWVGGRLYTEGGAPPTV